MMALSKKSITYLFFAPMKRERNLVCNYKKIWFVTTRIDGQMAKNLNDTEAETAKGRSDERPFACVIKRSKLAFDHHLLDLADRLGWVQTLGAGFCAVHDCVAAIQTEWIFQLIQPFTCRLIPAVDDPAIGVQQGCRTEVAITVPPI